MYNCVVVVSNYTLIYIRRITMKLNIKIIRFIETSSRCVWCGENAVVDLGGEDYCMACSTIQ